MTDEPIWKKIDSSLSYDESDFSPGLLKPGELETFQSVKREEKFALGEIEREKKVLKKKEKIERRNAIWKKYPDIKYRATHKYKCPYRHQLDTVKCCAYGNCLCEQTGKLPRRPSTREFP